SGVPVCLAVSNRRQRASDSHVDRHSDSGRKCCTDSATRMRRRGIWSYPSAREASDAASPTRREQPAVEGGTEPEDRYLGGGVRFVISDRAGGYLGRTLRNDQRGHQRAA